MHALLRFLVAQRDAVPRETAFFQRFVAETPEFPLLKKQATTDVWLVEHIGRLFWVCCESNLLQIQYPYPLKGQTFAPTRAGRILACAPRWSATLFIALAYAIAVTADPVKKFNRTRNIVTAFTGALLWWRHHELSALIVAVSIGAGVVSTWITSFFAGMED